MTNFYKASDVADKNLLREAICMKCRKGAVGKYGYFCYNCLLDKQIVLDYKGTKGNFVRVWSDVLYNV